MLKYIFAFITFVYCVWSVAEPIVDTPVLNPANPVVGQPVSVELHDNPCLSYQEPPDSPVVVSRAGNDVTLLVQAISPSDGILCNYTPQNVLFGIGSFASGAYSVDVQAQYATIEGTVTQDLGTIDFIVPAPDPAPTTTIFGGLLLAVLLAVGATLTRGRI